MKRIFLTILVIMVSVSWGYAANLKVSELTETQTLTDDDLFLVSTYSGGAYTSKYIKKNYLVTSLGITNNAATMTVIDTTDATAYVALFDSATGNLAIKTDTKITFDATTGILTATGFAGPLTGAVTGTASGNIPNTLADAAGDIIQGSADNTWAKLAIGTAYQIPHVNSGATALEYTSTLGATGTRLTKIWATDLELTNAPTIGGAAWTTILQPLNDDLTILAGGGTANCIWGEKSDASGIECKTTLNLQLDDSAAQFKSATASKGTLKFDQTGISDTKLVTVKYTAADSYAFTPTLLGNVSLSLGTTFTDGKYCTYSTANGFTCNADGGGGAGDLKADGSVPMTGALVPNAANTIALGSASAEWADIYLGDSAVIYGENDSSNTITSSATGWAFAKAISATSVSTTAGASTGGYLRLLEGSNNGTDYSMITGIADAGTTAAFTFGGSSTTENVILTIPATTSTEATVTSSSGITSINFSAIQVRDTKVISADTDNEAMTASQMGRIWTNTGDSDGTVFTLPEASTVLGQSVTFAVTVAQNLDVNPNDGTDQIMGLTNAAGDAVRCATIGCTLTLTAVTANMWMVTSSYGTWADID